MTTATNLPITGALVFIKTTANTCERVTLVSVTLGAYFTSLGFGEACLEETSLTALLSRLCGC